MASSPLGVKLILEVQSKKLHLDRRQVVFSATGKPEEKTIPYVGRYSKSQRHEVLSDGDEAHCFDAYFPCERCDSACGGNAT